MNDFRVTLQIFSGSFLKKETSYSEIEQKLLSVLPRLPVNKVLMGWALDKTIYEKTAEFLAKRDIDFYLWFPVFSETGALRELSALVDFTGQRIESRKGHKNEDFSFCCPHNPQNTEKILDIFEQEFASIPFNGVFLDRIRYPSFANKHEPGSKSVLTCFCPHCIEFYERENFNIEQLRNVLSRSTQLGITEYRDNGEYVFNDPAIACFFSLKASNISKSLRRLCGYFREKNYSIGLDVFAPFLSAFVGQNLKTLSGLCDFMKPMMYRVTNAPAGLPFETEALLGETNCASDSRRLEFYKILGINPKTIPFDLTFTVKELKNLSFSSACDVYAGLEINKIENIAEANPDYIEKTIEAYAQTGIQGLALSWNLLNMPEENLAKAAETIKLLTKQK
ncbi:MAG: hypothetical protein LBH42_06595 [Treponema sp.]|jgi:hypothetical protein|nr:hypothetical protein [Treponema sp.]